MFGQQGVKFQNQLQFKVVTRWAAHLALLGVMLLSINVTTAQVSSDAIDQQAAANTKGLTQGMQKYQAYAAKKGRKHLMPSFSQMANAKHSKQFVLVKFKASYTATDMLDQLGVKHDRRLSIVRGLRRMRIKSNVSMEQLLERLNAHPAVDYAEPDYIIDVDLVPNDTAIGGASAWWLNQINAYEAWDYATDASAFGPVSVFDTGIDYSHPDLSDNLWSNPDEIAGNGIDDDGNGYVDDIHGIAVISGSRSHGTSVGGTICAQGNNGFGVVGSAWDCELMDVLSVGTFSNTVAAVAIGMNYSLDKGSRLSNHSWSMPTFSQALADTVDAAEQAGHLMVVSAGNLNNNLESIPRYPASLPNANIIPVAASTVNGSKISYSSYGNVTVDLAAPTEFITTSIGGGYAGFSGTSQATPVVTGAVALLWSQVPSWTFQQVKDHLLNNVRPITSWTGLTVTGGILDMGAMMRNLVVEPQFSIQNVQLSESVGTAQVIVSLGVAAAQTVRVDITTEDDAALAGRDYVDNNAILVFSPGEVSKTFNIEIIDDARVESTELFNVRLNNAVGAPIVQGLASVSIADNDAGTGTGTGLIESVSNHGVDDNTFSLGYSFSLTRDMLIAELGALDINQNGVLDSPIDVGLWDATGSLLSATTVETGTPIDGQTFWASLTTPVVLSAGNEYVIAGSYNRGSEPYGLNGDVTTSSEINRISDRFVASTSLVFPTSTTTTLIHGPNLREAVNPDAVFSVSALEVNEDIGMAAVEVSLSPVSSLPATVSYEMIDASAVSGQDYTGFSGEFTFAPGETVKTINVPIIDDTEDEPAESFTVTLSDAAGGQIDTASAAVTILDDDNPVGSNACGEPSIDGATERALFLWQDCTGDNSWYVWATAGSGPTLKYEGYLSSDQLFSAVIGSSLEMQWGDILDSNTAGVIDFKMIVGSPWYDSFSFKVNPGNSCFTLDAPVGPTILVGENKVPVSSSFDIETLGACGGGGQPSVRIGDVSVDEGDGTANVSVNLSAVSGSSVMVNYQTTNGTATAGADYTGGNGTLTFNPGVTAQTISVPITQDTLDEANETFNVVLSNVAGALIVDGSAVVMIIDDDNPVGGNACGEPTFDRETERELFLWQDCTGDDSWYVWATAGSGATLSYVGNLSSDQAFTAITATSFELSDELNLTAPGVLDFNMTISSPWYDTFSFKVNPGNTCLTLDTPAGVTVLVGENKIPVSLPFNIETLGACVGGQPSVRIGDVSVDEGGGTANVSVDLLAASGSSVMVNYQTTNGTATAGADYTGNSGTATFNPGVTTQTISVPITQDALDEVNETFNVVLSNVVGASIGDGSAVVTIIDDDIPAGANACGEPSIDNATERALFLWQDCTGDDSWYVWATAGSGSTLSYAGNLSSDQTFTAITATSFEPLDVLNLAASGLLDFKMTISSPWYDRFSFRVNPGSTCLTLDAPAGVTILVGENKVPVNSRFNIETLGACP